MNRELLVIHLLAEVDGLTPYLAEKCADAFLNLIVEKSHPFDFTQDWVHDD